MPAKSKSKTPNATAVDRAAACSAPAEWDQLVYYSTVGELTWKQINKYLKRGWMLYGILQLTYTPPLVFGYYFRRLKHNAADETRRE